MVRVRFAPSPTGSLHVGNARTAVLNHLFARKEGGSFILRIEDTDAERSDPAFEASILKDLSWLGCEWDEGPFRQTERLDIYRLHADALLASGRAYRCFCSREDLEKERAQAVRRGMPPRYSGRCRSLAPGEAEACARDGKPFVLRFKSPAKRVTFQDLIHGPIEFPQGHVEDFIIMRADGTPAYNFAVVVDDMEMAISHVLRGSDHLSNTPKQIMLFEVFDREPPLYGHHGLVMGPDNKPLSKRHGATTVGEFREEGILSEAFVNYLGIMGRKVAHEFQTREELVAGFSPGSIGPSDALFDMKKLMWLNKEHMRRMDISVLLHRLGLDGEFRNKVAVLRENASTLKDLRDFLDIFETDRIDDAALEYLVEKADIAKVVVFLRAALTEGSDLEQVVQRIEQTTGVKRRDAFLILRLALTGRRHGPPLTEVYRLMTKGSILRRLGCLETRLTNPKSS